MRARVSAAFLLVGVIWGSEWLITRDLEAQTLGALALRYAIAATALGAVFILGTSALPGAKDAIIYAVTGFTFLAAPAILVAWAGTRLTPGLLVVILAMTPLLAALIEGRASGSLLIALVGGVAGTALLASQGLSFAPEQWPGAAAVFAAAGLIAGSAVWMKARLLHAPAVSLSLIQLISAASALAIYSKFSEGRTGFAWSRRQAGVEALLAIAGSAAALPLYYWTLRRAESFQLTASQWLVTFVGVGEGLVLVGERPGWRIAAGAGVLLASLAALLRTRADAGKPVTLSLTPPSVEQRGQ